MQFFSLVCIYAPNSKTKKHVSNFCKEHGTGILVVGGDFNEIMQDIDRRSLRTGNVCKQSVNSLKSLHHLSVHLIKQFCHFHQ
jgi:hypothetical protein